jgi:2-polyprenyl-3-methyl-5-hydroxy-6-metoxy-1,4-benzoquinol methylase
MKTAEKFWDNLADNFDKSEKRFDKIHVASVENTKEYLKAEDIVLDYGCATGTKTLALANHAKGITGIDISAKMIAIAERKAVEYKVENIDFSHATIFDESLMEESFDVVLAFNILHAVKENHKAVERIFKLLKPEGRFISVTPCLKEKMNLVSKLQLSSYLLLMKLGLLPSILTRFKTPDLEDLLTTKGFQIVVTNPLYHKLMSNFIVAKKMEAR